MERVSVIIPTVQKNPEVLQHLVNILNADYAVSEIIIINNAVKPFEKTIIGTKVKIFSPANYLYVNKSWNVGVILAENDIFLIINDDIICTNDFCTKFLETGIINSPDCGLIGIDNDCIKTYASNKVDISFYNVEDTPADKFIFNKLEKYLYTGDWGSAFFGRKSSYYLIPDKFKIIYGDNYLLYQNLHNGHKNYVMSGLYFNHIHSLSSSSPEFSNIIAQDIDAANDYFNVNRNYTITIDLNNLG